jgi:hypothetical protein
MASTGGQVYEEEYKESSLLEENDFSFSAQEKYFHERAFE